MTDVCCVCNKPGDLRPYGPAGKTICYDCATATPESEDAARQVYRRTVNAASLGSRTVLIGGPEGPLPVKLDGEES